MALFFACLVGISTVAFARDFKFGDLLIQVEQQKKQGGLGETISGSVKVIRNKKVQTEKTYDEMNSVGGWAGFRLPRKQPRTDLFLILKYGDYDTRVLAVTRNGNILDIANGDIYVDSEKIYSIWTEDDITGYQAAELNGTGPIEKANKVPPEITAKVKKMKKTFNSAAQESEPL